MAISEDMSDVSDVDFYEHLFYWTDTARSSNSMSAWFMNIIGVKYTVSYAYSSGVRPVVRILKSNL